MRHPVVYGRPLMSELYYGTVIQALSNNKAGVAVTYYYQPFFKGCHRIGISTIPFNSLHQIVHKNVFFVAQNFYVYSDLRYTQCDCSSFPKTEIDIQLYLLYIMHKSALCTYLFGQ